jgi:hypothetical protein
MTNESGTSLFHIMGFPVIMRGLAGRASLTIAAYLPLNGIFHSGDAGITSKYAANFPDNGN